MTTAIVSVHLSKNSIVARSGFSAEDLLCKSTHILHCLSTHYFQKPIAKCEKIRGHTKSDLLFTFEDGSHARAQLKNGTGGGRGWSFDRRPVENLPVSQDAKELIRSVCLRSGGERKAVPMDTSMLRMLLLGENTDYQPEHYIHTTIHNNNITAISACPTDTFLNAILKDAYDTFLAKKTCVHLTNRIYLQRKGGGKADHAPDHIQAKLRCMPDCMTSISLSQTTSEQQEQMPEEH